MADSKLDFLFVHCEAGISPLHVQADVPPIGLVGLATFLNSNGFRCRVVDGRRPTFSIPWFADYLAETKPRWVGVDVMTDTILTAARLVNVVREVSPSSRIALGGAHATLCPEDVLLKLEPDVVVRGEGELPCIDLLRKTDLQDVKGIAFKHGDKPRLTAHPPLIDMDLLPSPDYSVVEGLAEMPYVASIVTGRGCPYRCAFCAAGTLSPTVRWRSVPKVMEDIATVRRALPGRLLMIADDTFTVDRKRTEEFCRAMKGIGGGKDLFWYAEGRVDRLSRNLSLLSTMKDAGLIMMQLGIESGDDRVLKLYRKQITIKDAEKVCAAVAKQGILLHAGFILGGPFESQETLDKTWGVAVRLTEVSAGLSQTQFSFLNPLPGTEIYEHPEKYGIEILDRNLYTSTAFDNAVTQTEALSREEIVRTRHKFLSNIMDVQIRIFNDQGEEFRNYCREILNKVGLVHMALRYAESTDRGANAFAILNDIFKRAAVMPQFAVSAGDYWKELIPARLPFFSADEAGHYTLPIQKEVLSELESEVFHYSSGKLMGSDVALILDRSDDELFSAFESLEEKRAIVYRLY